MAHRRLLTAFLLFAVLTSMNQEETSQEFDCCKLPHKIPIDLRNDYEFYIGNECKVTVGNSTIETEPPFSVHDKNTLVLSECVDYSQKTVFINERGFTDDNTTHYRSQKCISTGLSKGVLAAIILGVIGFVIAVIAGVFWIVFRREPSDGTARHTRGRPLTGVPAPHMTANEAAQNLTPHSDESGV